MYSSMNNFKENISKAQDAKTSKVDEAKMKDDTKELDGNLEKVDDGVNKITDDIIRDGSQLENGKLKPNITYQTGEHEYIYKTDDSGFIKNAHADKLQLKTHEGRLNHKTNTIGKEIGDQAGHVFGDRFGGSPELDNLISQAQKVNQSKFKILENKWAKSLKEGKTVSVDIDIHYDTTGTGRPISFDVYYTIDGISYFETIINKS